MILCLLFLYVIIIVVLRGLFRCLFHGFVVGWSDFNLLYRFTDFNLLYCFTDLNLLYHFTDFTDFTVNDKISISIDYFLQVTLIIRLWWSSRQFLFCLLLLINNTNIGLQLFSDYFMITHFFMLLFAVFNIIYLLGLVLIDEWNIAILAFIYIKFTFRCFFFFLAFILIKFAFRYYFF